jgi:hypothetical protein
MTPQPSAQLQEISFVLSIQRSRGMSAQIATLCGGTVVVNFEQLNIRRRPRIHESGNP